MSDPIAVILTQQQQVHLVLHEIATIDKRLIDDTWLKDYVVPTRKMTRAETDAYAAKFDFTIPQDLVRVLQEVGFSQLTYPMFADYFLNNTAPKGEFDGYLSNNTYVHLLETGIGKDELDEVYYNAELNAFDHATVQEYYSNATHNDEVLVKCLLLGVNNGGTHEYYIINGEDKGKIGYELQDFTEINIGEYTRYAPYQLDYDNIYQYVGNRVEGTLNMLSQELAELKTTGNKAAFLIKYGAEPKSESAGIWNWFTNLFK